MFGTQGAIEIKLDNQSRNRNLYKMYIINMFRDVYFLHQRKSNMEMANHLHISITRFNFLSRVIQKKCVMPNSKNATNMS